MEGAIQKLQQRIPQQTERLKKKLTLPQGIMADRRMKGNSRGNMEAISVPDGLETGGKFKRYSQIFLSFKSRGEREQRVL
ncbi:hypothetical protein RRG08_049065 [Elysia crispata]|uniref:Uncharacterized protein n=1 Tax=Elysia crispata TaxID=231223 RepID=A0AAE1DVJ5_9GAST|nr:hypothetical protein RRG08_049065 [Elysia crispata]